MAHEINHTDFEPKMVKKSFWGVKTYESTELVMEQVNEWTKKNYNREIINMETLVLPHSNDTLKKGNTRRLFFSRRLCVFDSNHTGVVQIGML
jgi:hypothetical protein